MSAVNSNGGSNLQTLGDGLRELIGQPLGSVEFVQDYVQMHFDGPTLTAYTLPTITVWPSRALVSGESGWRDALCEQIGSVVRRAEVDADGIAVTLENGAVISVSLKDEDYRGPEAVQFALDGKHTWVA